MLLRQEHAVKQHIHVGPGSQDGACHPLLTLRKNEVRDSTLGVIVAPMILLIPVGVLDSIVGGSVDVVLYALMPRDFVSSNPIEEFTLLSYREAIGVHPGTPDAMERFVQVFLIILAALDKTDIRQFRYVLGTFGVGIASKHSNGVATTLGESFQKS